VHPLPLPALRTAEYIRRMLDSMRLSPNELVALLVATGFAAGLNVYAIIGTLGLLAHFGLLSLR
jgi:hypothetical protein